MEMQNLASTINYIRLFIFIFIFYFFYKYIYKGVLEGLTYTHKGYAKRHTLKKEDFGSYCYCMCVSMCVAQKHCEWHLW